MAFEINNANGPSSSLFVFRYIFALFITGWIFHVISFILIFLPHKNALSKKKCGFHQFDLCKFLISFWLANLFDSLCMVIPRKILIQQRDVLYLIRQRQRLRKNQYIFDWYWISYMRLRWWFKWPLEEYLHVGTPERRHDQRRHSLHYSK